MSRVKNRRRKKSNRVGMLSVSIIVIMIVGIFSVKSIELQAKEEEYQYKVDKLKQQVTKEQNDAEDLKEQEKYMQTKKFVEEYAQEKLGLVYPNEIIFKTKEK